MGPANAPRLVTNSRANRIAIALLCAVAIATCAAALAGAGIESRMSNDPAAPRLGGDYPAFHAAGAIVLDGDFDQIYSKERHLVEQAAYVPNGYIGFAYPPHVAFAYAPLAALGFRLGYFVHTLLMAAAVVASMLLLRKPVPAINEHFLPALAATLTFYPLLRAVGGGQNTPFTLLLLAALWRCLHDDRDLLAGVVLGILWFRPQYAIPLFGLLLLDRRFRTLASAAVMGIATWVITAIFMGSNWLTVWLDSAQTFLEQDEVNAGIAVSPIGFVQALAGRGTIATAVGAAVSAMVVVTLITTWGKSPAAPLPLRFAAAATGILMISPHVLFYDAGLLVIAGAGLVAAVPGSRTELTQKEQSVAALTIVAALWIAVLVHPAAAALDAPATPLAVLVAAIFVYLIYQSRIVRAPQV